MGALDNPEVPLRPVDAPWMESIIAIGFVQYFCNRHGDVGNGKIIIKKTQTIIVLKQFLTEQKNTN